MNVSLFALLRDKTTAKSKNVKKELSCLQLPSLNREESPIDALDPESLSRYIKMQAAIYNEGEEGIQRYPSEASLLFQKSLDIDSISKPTANPSYPQSHAFPPKTAIKHNIRRGLLKLPGNVLLMRAAQHDSKIKIDYGVKTSTGRRPYMEDRHIMKPSFLTFPITLACSKEVVPAFVVSELQKTVTNLTGVGSQWTAVMSKIQRPTDGNVQCVFDDFSLFLICDGHGGSQVAQHCTAAFQRILTEQLQSCVEEIQAQLMYLTEIPRDNVDEACEAGALAKSCKAHEMTYDLPERSAKSASSLGDIQLPMHIQKSARLFRNFESASARPSRNTYNRDVQKTDQKMISDSPSGPKCGLNVNQMKECLFKSFQRMDAEVKNLKLGEYEGSTALAILVGGWHICVANCGDSRAVLSRNGVAVRLTRDHKPHIEEERSRIERNGGFVLDTYGCSRVNGFLAISRAIGDHLFPSVIANPDVTILHRHQFDEFLICATDGLWDVMSDEVACQMTRRCLARAEEKGATSKVSTRVAANVLLRAALDKGSTDNITITVVDLRNNSKTGDTNTM